MSYEVRINGWKVAEFGNPEAALNCARALMAADSEAEVEVLDAHTRRAYSLASSLRWRDELTSRMA